VRATTDDQQIDIAFTYNPKSQNLAAAKVFTQWTGSAEFAALYSNALPGFFTLGDYQVQVDALSATFTIK